MVVCWLCMLQGGFVTTSEVEVQVTQRENDVIYQCHGTNEALGQTAVDTITLKVMCKLHTIIATCYCSKIQEENIEFCVTVDHVIRTNSIPAYLVEGTGC